MINVSKLAKPTTKRNTQDDWSVKWPWHVYNKETATITCSWCIEYMEEHSAEELSRLNVAYNCQNAYCGCQGTKIVLLVLRVLDQK